MTLIKLDMNNTGVGLITNNMFQMKKKILSK